MPTHVPAESTLQRKKTRSIARSTIHASCRRNAGISRADTCGGCAGLSDRNAVFVVIEVLKGDVAPGQRIRIRSFVGPGDRGRSARNDPPWIEEIEASGESSKPLAVSREWLIYGYGTEPYERSHCDRSSPLNVLGASDLAHLRRRLGRSDKQGMAKNERTHATSRRRARDPFVDEFATCINQDGAPGVAPTT